jgi:hypothetical protein
VRRSILVALWLAAACGDNEGTEPGPDPAEVSARLAASLDQLTALGDRRAASPGGVAAGDLVMQRLIAAGVEEVHVESFRFPAFAVAASELAVTIDGEAAAVAHDVFYYSGAGAVDAELVDLGDGHPSDYDGVDVTGKVCLVVRDTTFHRSSQYRECAGHGGAAMLYVSQAPDNLIQVGTVTLTPGMGPIPAITVGADDGAALRAAIAGGSAVSAAITVDASESPGVGRNIVGTLPGREATSLVIGAHYDSWFAGAADNATGTAALLELAGALAARRDRRHGITLVAYDGEEIGLFGGYDFLRDHVFAAGEPVLAFVNLEMPATGSDDVRALGHTNHAPLDSALSDLGARSLYPLYVGMEAVPELFGGVIPTDIQGMYWAGLAGFSTACDSPYYHTVEDVPERIDLPFLTSAVLAFEQVIAALDEIEPSALLERDRALWSVAVSTAADGDDLEVSALVTDSGGEPAAGAVVTAFVEVDDFTRVHAGEATAGADGRAALVIPAAALTAGSGSRWLHVTAGSIYPLAEHITPLD